MSYIQSGYRGISFLLALNFDRILFVGLLCLALSAAAWMAHP